MPGLQQSYVGDFPGEPVVKNLSAIAGDPSSIPGLGSKIPRAMGQLSPCATTRKPIWYNYRARAIWSLCVPTKTQEEKPKNFYWVSHHPLNFT